MNVGDQTCQAFVTCFSPIRDVNKPFPLLDRSHSLFLELVVIYAWRRVFASLFSCVSRQVRNISFFEM